MTRDILRPGTAVAVQPGIRHPGLGISLAGWHGRVTDIQQLDDGETYVAVFWDSQTLTALPQDMVRYLADVDWEWRGWVFTPDQLVVVAPRDTEAEAEAAESKIFTDLLADFEQLRGSSGDPDELLLDAIDWEEEEEEPEFFDVDLFLSVLQIPEAEWEAVSEALALGLADYYRQQVGTYRYGKRPYFLIPSKLTNAPIFGYAALAVIEHPHISSASKQKVAYFACQTSDPFAHDHIPYGLISFVSFLAAQDALSLDLFRGVMLALEMGDRRECFAGWSLSYAQQLSDWLLNHAHMRAVEKQWWLWHIGVNLGGEYFAHIGKALVPQWLAAAQLSYEIRLELAWAWVQRADSLGLPPPNWRLMQATLSGDVETAEAIAVEMQLEAQLHVDETDILADLERTPHIAPMPDHHGPGSDPVGFLQMLMGIRFGGFTHLPAYMRRLAVAGLLTMGEKVTLVAEEVFALHKDTDAAALQEGLADGLNQLGAQVSPDLLQQLIERGIAETKASARKLFYELGAARFGDDYIRRAAQDSAKSVRDWAARSLQVASQSPIVNRQS